MPTTWITNVPCDGGCKAASRDTAPVRERRQYGNAVQFLAIVISMLRNGPPVML